MIEIRHPCAKDGANIWHLVKSTQILDVNSAYAYLLMCTHFSKTCAVAEKNGQLLGFVTGYFLPEDPTTWFVWQVGVSSTARKQGLAKKMLHTVLDWHPQIRMIETTVSPSNQASRALFGSLSEDLECDLVEKNGFTDELFPEPHESEPLLCIGPLPGVLEKTG